MLRDKQLSSRARATIVGEPFARKGGERMICNLGSRAVNTYVVPCGDGYIVIDTGYPGGFPRFARLLEKHRIDPEDIRYVFLTHAHDDHAGFLNEVLAATDARVILHPKAIAGLMKGRNSFEGGCPSLRAYLFCRALALLGHGEHRYPPIKEEYMDRLVPIGSEAFYSLDFPYKVVETPGHTADHISLLMGDVLFCGDAAMNNFPSTRRTTIWIEDLERYRQTWEAILELGPSLLYPAHGKPFPASDLRTYLPSLDAIKLRALKPAG